MVKFYTPGGIGTVRSDPAPVIEYLIAEQKKTKDAHPFPALDTMQIGVIEYLPLEDVSPEIPDSDQPMEVDVKESSGLDLVQRPANLLISPLPQEVEKY